ncbi:Serine/threonine-protein phosphatase PP1-beta catalytic subunit [Folsomia candida]|uniref:Serine/threonine-protein phosphatase n=1 Tax=Folsomia candida TaxID=158441 RepID=A0A226DPG6_FOLCA|nr:Serine/threonine-protein phosphatase PP1-beta catalytic subunit [Folsomia candida]
MSTDLVKSLVTKLMSDDASRKKVVAIHPAQVLNLCTLAKKSFLRQPSLLEIDGPLRICGDIHGQFHDLRTLFRVGGAPPKTRYLFLGDYASFAGITKILCWNLANFFISVLPSVCISRAVTPTKRRKSAWRRQQSYENNDFVDRGQNSLEVICLLLGLKVLHPDSVFLLRGNHEVSSVNEGHGFYSEIKRRFRTKGYQEIYARINQTFDYMPLAGVVSSKIFCVHGGISPKLRDLDQIRNMRRPKSNFYEKSWASDVLWSDPADDIATWERQSHPDTNPRHRGAGYLYGGVALDEFLTRNDLRLLARGHECVEGGYLYQLGRKCVTIFSAPSYCGNSHGVMMRVSRTGNVLGFTTFK